MERPTRTKDDWNIRYETSDTPWDSGVVSGELQRVLKEYRIEPCPTLEVGCGTGTNAVYLARQGFEVMGIDLSSLAIERAQRRVADAGVTCRLVADDLLTTTQVRGSFGFIFDSGCYHAVRRVDEASYVRRLHEWLAPAGWLLVLAGNPREGETGPPVVSEEEIRSAFSGRFNIVHLRETRFDARKGDFEIQPLAWSLLVRPAGTE